MKPKDLKSPFSWEKRRPVIEDRVWYVPHYYDRYEAFAFPGWEALFGNDNPVMVEYCSGNGDWVVDKAMNDSSINWVAVEKRFDRVRKIWSKSKNMGVENLIVVSGEAYTATQDYFPTESVAGVFINFPDPWPKKRHHKHRLMSPSFVDELWRILEMNAIFTLVTDDAEYSELSIESMLQRGDFVSLFPEPYWGEDIASYGGSYFDELWRRLGRKIRYHQFRKDGSHC